MVLYWTKQFIFCFPVWGDEVACCRGYRKWAWLMLGNFTAVHGKIKNKKQGQIQIAPPTRALSCLKPYIWDHLYFVNANLPVSQSNLQWGSCVIIWKYLKADLGIEPPNEATGTVNSSQQGLWEWKRNMHWSSVFIAHVRCFEFLPLLWSCFCLIKIFERC